MVVVGLLSVIGLIWLAAGLALIAVPGWWRALMPPMVSSPGPRFAFTHVMILIGLTLLIGTSSLQTVWLWVALGTIAVLKGMFFLGASEGLRMKVLDWSSRTPTWVHRIAGLCLVGLAMLLTIEAIRIVR